MPTRRLPWFLLYLALAILPGAASMLLAAPPYRPLAIEVGVALGYVGLTLFALQFVTTGRYPRLTGELGMDELMRLHRWSGVVAGLCVVVHPLLLLWVHPVFLSFLDPRANAPRALALWAALGILVVVTVGPFLKRRLRLDHGWWRLSHGALGALLVTIGTAHVLMVGHFTNVLAKQAWWVLIALVSLGLLIEARVLRPLARRRTPWRVRSVRPLCERTWAVEIEAEGHPGLPFRGGQFAWLTLGDNPFSLEQHPFSFASSATDPRRLEFAIKELGDFTRTIGQVQPGTRAFVEGPYGTFALPEDPTTPLLLLGGGIGVAPMVSMLRTLAARGDRRALTLVHATATLATAAYVDELDALAPALDLELVRVLEDPPRDWSGARGFIDRALLEPLLAAPRLQGAHIFLCGPVPMMRAVERTLRELGIPRRRIEGERFDVF